MGRERTTDCRPSRAATQEAAITLEDDDEEVYKSGKYSINAIHVIIHAIWRALLAHYHQTPITPLTTWPSERVKEKRGIRLFSDSCSNVEGVGGRARRNCDGDPGGQHMLDPRLPEYVTRE